MESDKKRENTRDTRIWWGNKIFSFEICTDYFNCNKGSWKSCAFRIELDILYFQYTYYKLEISVTLINTLELPDALERLLNLIGTHSWGCLLFSCFKNLWKLVHCLPSIHGTLIQNIYVFIYPKNGRLYKWTVSLKACLVKTKHWA